MGLMAAHLRWDRQTLRLIGEEVAELVTEDPEDPVAMEAREADLMAATVEANLIPRGGITEGARKVGKETVRAAQEAADLAMEVASAGGPMVQDGGTMVRMVTLSGQL